VDAAIAQAAHDTLAVLYPSQAVRFLALLTEDLRRIPDGRAKTDGIDLGRRAASAILTLRSNDGSQHAEPRVGSGFLPRSEPGKWRPDPISQIPLAVGALWERVHPFVLPPADRFAVPPPPALTSAEYTAAFNEVKRLGGDGVITPTERTAEQTTVGIYWAYDGTPGLGTPPRLFNQIAVQIATERGLSAIELARLLALVNVAMADATLASWDMKYDYQFWRPVTAIREADVGTGPTGAGDGNPAAIGDPTFTPLGAPASNLVGPNFTPPFPSYTSGHATMGGATFQVLRHFFGTDSIAFSFMSDEFNGVTRDNQGRVRPLLRRSFSTLSQAEEENGQSRIYLGIHWAFDKTVGITQGRRVAAHVFSNAFLPVALTGATTIAPPARPAPPAPAAAAAPAASISIRLLAPPPLLPILPPLSPVLPLGLAPGGPGVMPIELGVPMLPQPAAAPMLPFAAPTVPETSPPPAGPDVGPGVSPDDTSTGLPRPQAVAPASAPATAVAAAPQVPVQEAALPPQVVPAAVPETATVPEGTPSSTPGAVVGDEPPRSVATEP
jgi:membrane-associated phospholipid phosphatase